MTTFRLEMIGCTDALMQEIGDKGFKRKDVALSYAMAMLSSEPTDWPKVNKAILDRWSMSGLEWIKKRAHKLARGEHSA